MKRNEVLAGTAFTVFVVFWFVGAMVLSTNEPGAMARVTPVYEAHEAVADIAHNDLWARKVLCAARRRAFPWIEQRVSDESAFRRFADLFGISQETAHSYFWKHEFWMQRHGLTWLRVPSDR